MASKKDVSDANGDDRGTDVIISYWVQGFFAILIIVLRFWARKSTKAIGLDDWLMLGALIMYLTLSAFITYSATIGGFRHLYSLTASQQENALRWNYIYQVWALWTVTPGKASVAWQIYRIIRPKRGWRFWTLVVWVFLVTFFNTSNVIFTFVQCDPVSALWDQSYVDADCWPVSVQTSYAITTSTVNVFVDVVLTFVSWSIVAKLQMESNKKISLAVLLGLSLCAAITGSIKTAYLANLGERADLTWNVYELVLLAGAEIFVIIVCGSIPPIRPLWVRYVAPLQAKSPFGRIRNARQKKATTTSSFESELRSWNTKYTSDEEEQSKASSNSGTPRHQSV